MRKSRKSKKKIILSRGKRKRAIARAYIKSGKGNLRINKLSLDAFTSNKYVKSLINELISFIGAKWKKIDVDVNVKGGGIMGQIDAIRRAIAVGVSNYFNDEKMKEDLYNYDPSLIVEDTRRIESKKDRQRKARAKYQKSYR